ncbi:TPA: zinc ribbon domain-containing protein [Burkholderia vietnamiensis]|uniref:zinc ribbon domain-containing protein n=1 Tax=Burkholderia vietnamiensis TaxID=60552 RepID=UPI00075DB6F7|nr:zinc ribbon domain-containing protein [Burkholderia vietnamiensis]MBR8012829.1 zinc ribbon domain-containing protein [Burkholderia vietnamiensis]MBR8229871.1 zinc ribbon domain-containing protein [Burkholderia vietnamiensis]MCA8015445.1 zinc ribbon domain-containing protein [Burkholderia vietnamiensis]MCA8449658.1 zinc ribbon domain-containing protein [Burkholderia vietnamiensis]MDN8068509.1 zinc ribbon domain-containing protein [Burkholderia vietnamiensis]
MGLLKRVFGGWGGRHGGGHGGSHGSHGGGHGSGPQSGHGGGHHGERGRELYDAHDAHGRDRDRHDWGRQPPTGGRGVPGADLSLRQLVCAGCGALNAPAARFCAQCGVSQRGRACGRCQAALAADARFCPNCGTQAG